MRDQTVSTAILADSSGKDAKVPACTGRIWIDLDNTPHVPFFKPIIHELEGAGFEILLTARDAFQVCELADRSGLRYTRIGRHYGKNRILKVFGLLWRSLQLIPTVLRERPVLAVSHGARSQIFLANLLRIPTVLIMDYEHAKTPPMVRPKWEIIPDAISANSLYVPAERVRTYAGIKEDVYAAEFRPANDFAESLGLCVKNVIVTVRPPATEAHYHNPESETLFVEFMKMLHETPGAQAVLLPRNKKQAEEIIHNWPQWFESGKVIIPKTAVDGLNLLWHSDLVVSGGGTMNREAAALGVPVYSIFRGPIGAVDKRLAAEGRLHMIVSAKEVREKIRLVKRDASVSVNSGKAALQNIIEHLRSIASIEARS
jgi:uncharacterized protein